MLILFFSEYYLIGGNNKFKNKNNYINLKYINKIIIKL